MKENFLNLLSELIEVKPEHMVPDTQLFNLSLWDSLAMVSTIGLIDQCFGIKVTSESLMECKTLGDIFFLVNFSEKKHWKQK